MNDSNNDKKANDKAGLSHAKDTEPRDANPQQRTSDIYERFLDRVHSIESEHSHDTKNVRRFDKAKKTSSYEPLNEDELRLFLDTEEDVYPSMDTRLDNPDNNKQPKPAATHALDTENEFMEDISTDDDTVPSAANLAAEPFIAATAKNKKNKAGKPAGSSKLLIIGIVSGILLSIIVMALLTSTGILSASVDPLESNNPKPLVEAIKQPEPAGIDTNAAKLPTVNTTDPQVKQDLTITTDHPEEVSAVQQPSETNEVSNVSSETEPAITYEDFRQESQTTLYREEIKPE